MERESCQRETSQFFYPPLIRRKNVQPDHAKAATLDMLTAPWIILSYSNPKKNHQKGFVIFMRKRGHTVDEFLYLIEYLNHHHVIESGHEVTIRILDPHPNAAPNFSKAKDQYTADYQVGKSLNTSLMQLTSVSSRIFARDFCDKELSRQ